MSERRTRWIWGSALLLAPLIVLATQDNPLFTRPGTLDPWLYLGFFRDLVEYKRNLFPGTYYGSRLPFLLPGAALHGLFGTVTAGALLHLLIHSVATLSIFFAADAWAGRRAAWMTALLFSVHPWVWEATGWDNPDGAAMAYFALSIALAATAGRSRRTVWMLAGAGAAAAAAVYTNLFLAMLVVWLPFHAGKREWRALAGVAGRMLAGAGALTAVFCAVNRWIEGTWNFYAPSLRFALEKGGASSNPETAWGADGLQPWLWFAAAAAIAAAALLPMRFREAREGRPAPLVVSLHLLVCGGAMWYLQATGPTVLGLSYYASYLLPLTFLTIAVSFWPALDGLSPRGFAIAAAAACAAAALFWYDRAGSLAPLWPAGNPAVVAAAAVLLGGALLLRRRRVAIAAALAGWLLLSGYVRNPMPEDPHARRKDYAAIGAVLERISQARNARPVFFLLDENGAEDLAFITLASTYLNRYSIGARRIPEDACLVVPDPGQTVVVVSRRPDAARIAQSAVRGCWGERGLAPRVEAEMAVPLSEHPFKAILLRAVHDPARWRSLGPLPLDRWKVWVHRHDRGQFRQDRHGLWAITPMGNDYAFSYGPVVAPADGRYRFTLRYRPERGTIAFGAYRPEDLTWRHVCQDAHPVGDDREMTWLLDLRAGEPVHLLISQNGTPKGRRASLVMKELNWGVVGGGVVR